MLGGGESFVTPPTGKSCFVFVFALRACVRDATRREIKVYLGVSLSLLLLLLLLRPPRLFEIGRFSLEFFEK